MRVFSVQPFRKSHGILPIVAMIVVLAGLWFSQGQAFAQPTEYDRQADFSDHTENYPDEPQVGDDLDNEFNAIKATADSLISRLGLIQRDDGALANDSVGPDQLRDDLTIGITPTGDWATATDYEQNDAVWYASVLYRCETDHTSGTFSTDLNAGHWEELLDFATHESAASASASESASYASDAAAYAGMLSGTSTTSLAIGSGSKVFTTQSGKYFSEGMFVTIVSDAAPSTDYMGGQVTSYSGTSLTVSVASTGGSGTHADWTIYVSGAVGAQGAQGITGAGSGDMLNADNLAYLSSSATSRANLGVAIGSDVIGYTSSNGALNALVPDGVNQMPYYIQSSSAGLLTMSSTGMNVIGESPEGIRSALSLTSAATLSTGTSAGNIVVLDGSAMLPAVDGSQLTNLSSTSDWVLIESATASSQANVDFDNFTETDCAALKFVFSRVISAVASNTLFLRTSTNNGSSYDSGTNNYVGYNQQTEIETSGATVGSATGWNSISSGNLVNLSNTLSVGTSDYLSGEVTLIDPSDSSMYKYIYGNVMIQRNTTHYTLDFKGYRASTSDIDAVRFGMLAGNISSGKFYMYCLKNS